MRRFRTAAAWGLAVMLPTIVAAQSTSGTQSGTQSGTTSGTQSGSTTSGTQTSGAQTSGTSGTETTSGQTTSDQSGMSGGGWMGGDNQWMAFGFVGSNLASEDADQASFDFGGSVGYLWRGAVGAEFQANFSPNFELDPTRSVFLAGETPWINTYMFNAIAAIPIGSTARFQPYVSGGFGAMTLRADSILGSGTGGIVNDVQPDDTRGGGNLGAGVMGYAGAVGVRADVRWFRGFDAGDGADDPDQTPGQTIGRAVMADLRFWRANIGLAFRF